MQGPKGQRPVVFSRFKTVTWTRDVQSPKQQRIRASRGQWLEAEFQILGTCFWLSSVLSDCSTKRPTSKDWFPPIHRRLKHLSEMLETVSTVGQKLGRWSHLYFPTEGSSCFFSFCFPWKHCVWGHGVSKQLGRVQTYCPSEKHSENQLCSFHFVEDHWS